MNTILEKWAALKAQYAGLVAMYAQLRADRSFASPALQKKIDSELGLASTALDYFNRAKDVVEGALGAGVGFAPIGALAILAILAASAAYISNRYVAARELTVQLQAEKQAFVAAHPATSIAQTTADTALASAKSPFGMIALVGLGVFLILSNLKK